MVSQAVHIEISGLKELEQKLLKLEATVGRRALNQALRSASNKVTTEAKNHAPGSIKKAIFASRKVRGVTAISKATAAQLTIGIHYSGPKAAPHAHLLEYGTKRRKTRPAHQTMRNILRGRTSRKHVAKIGGDFVSLGTDRGRVKGRFFMHRAWKRHGGRKYVERFKKTLAKKIDKLTT